MAVVCRTLAPAQDASADASDVMLKPASQAVCHSARQGVLDTLAADNGRKPLLLLPPKIQLRRPDGPPLPILVMIYWCMRLNYDQVIAI
jgi:hypothetical protein